MYVRLVRTADSGHNPESKRTGRVGQASSLCAGGPAAAVLGQAMITAALERLPCYFWVRTLGSGGNERPDQH